MSVTQVADVETILGRPIPAPEDGQVQGWIDRVESRIRTRVSDLDDRLQDEAYRATLVGVVVDVVIRKVLNPTGMRSERIDDYYYDRGSEKADLWPTDAEWAELLPAVASGAFSTRPGFEPAQRHPHWWFV